MRAKNALPVAIVAVVCAFSANSLITRHIVRDHMMAAAMLTEVRFLAGALMLIAIALVRNVPRTIVPGRRNIVPAIWLGIYALLISYGYQHIGASAGTFVFYAAVFAALVAIDLGTGKRPSPRRLLGALIALSGLAVLAVSQLETVTPIGLILLAGCGIAWGAYTASGRGVANPLELTTGNFVALAVVFAVPFAITLARDGVAHVVTPGLMWGIAMGAGTTACAYPIWYWCLRHISGAQAGLFQLAIPILSGVGAVALLGEPFSRSLAIAAALVVVGLGFGR